MSAQLVGYGQRARPRHPDKEIERLIRDAEARGWTVSRWSGHWSLRHGSEHTATISCTPPRGGRVYREIERDLRCSGV